MFKLKRITPETASTYVGQLCLFRSGGVYYTKRINRVSPSGKTIYIDYPRLRNNVEVISRHVYVIIEQMLGYFPEE